MPKSVNLTINQLIFIANHFDQRIRELENIPAPARAAYADEIKQCRSIVDAIYDALPEWKALASRYSSQRP